MTPPYVTFGHYKKKPKTVKFYGFEMAIKTVVMYNERVRNPFVSTDVRMFVLLLSIDKKEKTGEKKRKKQLT